MSDYFKNLIARTKKFLFVAEISQIMREILIRKKINKIIKKK